MFKWGEQSPEIPTHSFSSSSKPRVESEEEIALYKKAFQETKIRKEIMEAPYILRDGKELDAKVMISLHDKFWCMYNADHHLSIGKSFDYNRMVSDFYSFGNDVVNERGCVVSCSCGIHAECDYKEVEIIRHIKEIKKIYSAREKAVSARGKIPTEGLSACRIMQLRRVRRAVPPLK